MSAAPSPSYAPIRRLVEAGLWSVFFTGIATYLFARERMNLLVSASVMWHSAAGVLLGMWWLAAAVKSRSGKPVLRWCAAISLATGCVMIASASAGISMGRIPWVFGAHICSSFALVAMLLAAPAARLIQNRRLRTGLAAVSLTLVLGAAGWRETQYHAESYYRRLMATNARQAENPLFPAGTISRPGASWPGQRDPDRCGSPGCHPDVVREWRSSRHAAASRSIGPTKTSRWCSGCHNTSSLFPTSRKDQPGRGRDVDCLACHSMVDSPIPTGGGSALYAPPEEYLFEEDLNPAMRRVHDFLLRLRPAPHVASLKPLRMRESANLSCAPCHRMSVGAAQNGYRFVRFDNTWTDWQQGPYSGETLRGFRIERTAKDCLSCHMPSKPDGRFEHSCPIVSAPSSTQVSEHAPRAAPMRVEIFGIRREQPNGTGAERLDAPLDGRTISISPGSPVIIEVVVENTGIGHAYPRASSGGSNDWLDVDVTSEDGRVLFSLPGRKAMPGDASHRYGQTALDHVGGELGPHDKDRAIAAAVRRFVGPGEADVAHYRWTVPVGSPGSAWTLRARLMRRRSMDRSAEPLVIAEHRVGVRVARPGQAPDARTAGSDAAAIARRFYVYGVGLLLQGETGHARRAFREAARLDPMEPLYLVGAARANLKEHDLLAATSALEQALKMRPGMPQALTWLVPVYRESGRFDSALEVLEPLTRQFPADRSLWMEMGLCREQSGNISGAIAAFQRALALDPDDAAAHLRLMLCYQSQRKVSLARREKVLFSALMEEEPPRPILEKYYNRHPGARLEAEASHEHILVPVIRQ